MQGLETAPQQTQNKRPSSIFNYAFAWIGGLLTGLIRVIPHPANFSAVGGLGIFAGSRIRSWWALSVPIGVMLVTDFGLFLATGLDPKYSPLHISRAYVYLSMMFYVAIGYWLCRQVTFGRVVAASLLGSIQFFLVTNFCDWLFQPMMDLSTMPAFYHYSRDLSGLLRCYALALPFLSSDTPYTMQAFMVGDVRLSFLGTVLGDLTFSGVFFGLHALATRAVTRPAQEAQEPELNME